MGIDVIFIGGGGHARALFDTAVNLGYRIVGLAVDRPAASSEIFAGIPIFNSDSELENPKLKGIPLINALGSTDVPNKRDEVYKRLKSRGLSFLSLVHPSAVVGSRVTISEGVQILERVVVQSGCLLQENALLNTGTLIEHDCIIGPSSHIGPGAVLCGEVIVGPCSHIGAGATVLQQIKVGGGALVGAGAVVLKNVENGARVAGNPALDIIKAAPYR